MNLDVSVHDRSGECGTYHLGETEVKVCFAVNGRKNIFRHARDDASFFNVRPCRETRGEWR